MLKSADLMTNLEILEMDEIRGSARDVSTPITSVSLLQGFAFVSLRPKEGEEHHWIAARAQVLARFAEREVSIELLQFARARMRFVVSGDDLDRVREVADACAVGWRVVPKCAKLCVVGPGIARTAGIFYRALNTLSEHNIPVLAFSDSHVTVSLIVPESHGSEAEMRLHEVLLNDPHSPMNATISFDETIGLLRINGRERRLGSRQARLLGFLLDNIGRVVTPEETARHLFGPAGKDDLSALRVHMHNLRKKVEVDPYNPRHIVTVPSRGYLFVR